ncbi:uncharacterized protein LOC126973312 isoform X2 [Leptidea sinapis]|nr:uncharacterized protein LOC126973312 isoform X2 [Leptidea sinapis]
MLCRQQQDLLMLMSRATSALLGNVPWIRGDIAIDCDMDSLLKIHHAFLVVQSSLLKYIALAHHIPSKAQKLYKNHNERIFWIHNTLIQHLIIEFKSNQEPLERMYRLLKNYATKDNGDMKRPGKSIKDNWLYSEIHTGVARTCLELKLALNKSNGLDAFLDLCAVNKQELELEVLNKDIDEIIDFITKSLSTMQCAQMRLKKLQNKFHQEEPKDAKMVEEIEDSSVLKIEQREPETRDEVFYLIRTDDDDAAQPVADVLTGPGQNERETTKIVLNELKRKLVKREDLMRERERQALAKTMPELKNIPEFPRQISLAEYADRKGFLSKIRPVTKKKKRLKNNKPFNKNKRCKLNICKYDDENSIKDEIYEASANRNVKSKLLTVVKTENGFIVNKWVKNPMVKENVNGKDDDLDSSELSRGGSDVESDAQSLNVRNPENSQNAPRNYKFNKGDLNLSSSESDFDIQNNELLDDVRRYRAVRKKNFPAKRASIDNVDESLRPIEYRFGTGMAMASVLQLNSNARIDRMAPEEVFIGDGEVSEDSGNDEDA